MRLRLEYKDKAERNTEGFRETLQEGGIFGKTHGTKSEPTKYLLVHFPLELKDGNLSSTECFESFY
jgi:hypothetical protein